MSVLIVGSVALDSVKTPKGRHEEMLGGSATYFSLSASHFAPVNLVAVVGKDFPDEYRKVLESKTICLDGLQVADGNTFRWSGEYVGSMNEANTLDTQLNVFEGFDPEIPSSFKESDWVFLGNIDPVLQDRVVSQVSDAGFVAMDTMNFWIEGARDKLETVLKKVNLLAINEGELKLLAREENVPRAAEIVTAMGPESLIVKRGEYGSILYHDSSWFYVPGYPEPHVVDPTGAGDSFAGGFMGSLARSGVLNPETIRKAMIYGSVMASYNITGFGPWKLADLSDSEIEGRYQAFRNLVML